MSDLLLFHFLCFHIKVLVEVESLVTDVSDAAVGVTLMMKRVLAGPGLLTEHSGAVSR